MARNQRIKTKYPGVYYVVSNSVTPPEKVYYIRYRKGHKQVEEKVGRQRRDDMTAARAAHLRMRKIDGEPTNAERRVAELKARRWTLAALWEEYKDQNPIKGIKADNDRFRKHLSPRFGLLLPPEIEQMMVDSLRKDLFKQDLSPQTVKHVLALLRRILNFGVRKNLIDPYRLDFDIPTVHNEKTEDITQAQLAALLIAIEDIIATEKDRFLIMGAYMARLVLFTGLRRGALFRLEWANIDFDGRRIRLVNTKGGVDQTIPMSDGAYQTLRDTPRYSDTYVFPGRQGGPMKSNRRAMQILKDKAGLPKEFRPFHGLRHVYASILASSGQVNLYTISKLLTHGDMKVTQRYAHLRDEVLRNATGVADQVINGARNKSDA